MNLEFQKHDKVLAHFNGYAINKFVSRKGYSGRVLPAIWSLSNVFIVITMNVGFYLY